MRLYLKASGFVLSAAALVAPTVTIAQRRPAPATIKKRVVTKSGDAEMLFATDLPNTRATLAGLCEKIGWKVRWQGTTSDTLRCDVPSTETTIVQMAGANPGNLTYLVATGTAVPIRKEVLFRMSRERGGTLARAQAARFYPAVSGITPVRTVIQDENTFNGLINIMALVGGRFAPGTHFQRVAYLGFRTDQIRKAPTSTGRETTGLIVGAVDAGSPAEVAKMMPGDVILTVNGKTFSDYEGATALMAKLRVGDPVVLAIERNGTPMVVNLVATDAPAIR